MTVIDRVPPVTALPAPWPQSARSTRGGHVTVAGVSLAAVAERYGTPAYVVDEAELRRRCRAFTAAFPAGAVPVTVAYAAKAFCCRAVASWVREEGLSLDVCSGGELAVARSVGFPAGRIVFHGNAKTPRELHDAVRYGVGRIVVDNLTEINRLAALASPARPQKVLLRVIPDIEAGAYEAVRTGGEGQKFGLSAASGDAAAAVARVLEQPGLELAGLHCHLGSQIMEAGPYERAARVMVEHLAAVRDTHGVVLPELDLGGGFGIAYLESDRALDLESCAASIVRAVGERCAGLRLPVPRLTVEPGRAISGPAGVTLYRVIAVKRAGGRTFAAVDGGMSDNPRPSLYGARYTMRMVGRRSAAGTRPTTVVGHHCEAGDVIVPEAPLPADLRPGDLIAEAATGAYHHSMASTYNVTGRPPVIAVSGGRARVVVRREESADLLSRDVGL